MIKLNFLFAKVVLVLFQLVSVPLVPWRRPIKITPNSITLDSRLHFSPNSLVRVPVSHLRYLFYHQVLYERIGVFNKIPLNRSFLIAFYFSSMRLQFTNA